MTIPKNSLRERTLRITWLFALALMVLGLVLISINFYGLTQPLRKPGLGVTDHDQLRFVPEQVWSYGQSVSAIEQLAALDDQQTLAHQANRVVNQSLIHINWKRVDPVEYRQLVPIWENYFLWAIGKFSGLPQFERYHYADYLRNLKRGIGICGDASTILSSILDRYGVPNRIISFRGHVIVEYQAKDGSQYLLDPDFGVVLGGSLKELVAGPERFKERYLSAGYTKPEIDYLFEAYRKGHSIFDDTYHFMTLRYLFEDVSYVMKWIMPILMMVLSGLYLSWYRRREASENSEGPDQ